MTHVAKTDVMCGVINDAALAQVLAAQPQLAEDVSTFLAAQEVTH